MLTPLAYRSSVHQDPKELSPRRAETIKDQALEASDMVVSKDDASILGGECDDVPSSAFIHGESDVV